ncbi:hypothetical protein ACVWXO_007897 [Bradyrhizobium sp. LM2.7]
MHALLDARGGAHGNAEQLDAITEIGGRTQIFRRDGRDTFDIHRALSNFRAEGEAGENGELLCGVVAVDVEGRIGLGIAEPLRILQAFGKG